MARAPSQTATTLRLQRAFDAPREKLFAAWTDAAALKRWFGPSGDYQVAAAEVDLRPGGRYRIEMQHSGGNVHAVSGTYREIQPPSRLVFTWKWEDGPDRSETLVTVEFNARGSSTELVLTHELFADAEARDKHAQGWTGVLDRLGRSL